MPRVLLLLDFDNDESELVSIPYMARNDGGVVKEASLGALSDLSALSALSDLSDFNKEVTCGTWVVGPTISTCCATSMGS